MGDKNPIRTLGYYSKPSHESYRNTIEFLDGNNVAPLRFDTIWLVQNGCSFHGLRPEDPNQHLKNFLKLVDSLDLDIANRNDNVHICWFGRAYGLFWGSSSLRIKISYKIVKDLNCSKKVKIAIENADLSSRVELIPSKIKYANKVVLKFHKEFSVFSSFKEREMTGYF
nr:MAK10-like protein [Tanacetum cinerariifolium]